MDAYWREGPDAVSLNEICRRAGVSKPGLYRAFGGEDKLLDAALEHYADVVLAPYFA
ncbi:MAG: helix-turn-helix transcriptional regulator, partial [Ilumatobacter sp.]|nr:helix-turn-helix transcriptional regulator [Ilumatobacter sp.]